MKTLQEWIHLFEVGSGTRLIRFGAAILSFGVLALAYYYLEYRSLTIPAAMDAAQLARNLAHGEGYTTKFVRPLSIHLLERRQSRGKGRTNDSAVLQTAHPDLANPPAYPVLLAGAMKVLPFDPVIAEGRKFERYQPDVMIAIINQGMFFLLLAGTFVFARRLFDSTVAWGSALALTGTALLWQFTVSGLPTMLLMLEFLLLSECLRAAEKQQRDGAGAAAGGAGLAVLAGALTGLGTLTRYAFGWMIVPVAIYLFRHFGRRGRFLPGLAVLAFLLVTGPWAFRNYQLSGTMFGTAGYAVLQQTTVFEGDSLPRSLEPSFAQIRLENYGRKLVVNLARLLSDPLPALGGNWVAVFFLAGLLVPFLDAGRGRLRGFLLQSLVVMAIVQSLAATGPPEEPGVSAADNLMICAAPLVFVYGVAMLTTLVEQLSSLFLQAHQVILGLALLVFSAPLILALLPPRADPRGYPPYFAPFVQRIADWTREDELIMSDQPWAVAWHANRQSVWTTLDVVAHGRPGEDFYAIHSTRKPVQGLLLTRVTMDEPLFAELLRVALLVRAGGSPDAWGDQTWAAFAAKSLLTQELPSGFPLRHASRELTGTGFLFLTDRARWQETPDDVQRRP